MFLQSAAKVTVK